MLLVLNESYNITILTKSTKKYSPKVKASLYIPKDITIKEELRPPAEDKVGQADFNQRYYPAIITDIYS